MEPATGQFFTYIDCSPSTLAPHRSNVTSSRKPLVLSERSGPCLIYYLSNQSRVFSCRPYSPPSSRRAVSSRECININRRHHTSYKRCERGGGDRSIESSQICLVVGLFHRDESSLGTAEGRNSLGREKSECFHNATDTREGREREKVSSMNCFRRRNFPLIYNIPHTSKASPFLFLSLVYAGICCARKANIAKSGIQ